MPEECWEVLQLFLACDTQWRYAEGVPTGLDFTAVEAVRRMKGMKRTPSLFDDLKVMEREALTVWGEERARKQWLNRSN